MNIFQKIKSSIYGPEFYRELLSKPFSFSLKYFFAFSALLALAASIYFSAVFMPKVNVFLKSIDQKVIGYYPSELVIKIEKGKVSTNVEEPYFIKLPSEAKINDQNYQNLLVIDTKTQFSVEKYKEYKSAIWLTNDSIVSEEKGDIKISRLAEVDSFTLDKAFVENVVAKVMPFVKYVYPVIYVFMFIGLYIFTISKLIYLLFGALLVWAVASIMKVKADYGKSYQMGLHLMTLPTIIYLLLPFQYKFFFLYSIMLIVMAVINLRKNEQSETVPAAPENPAGLELPKETQ